MEEKRIDRSKVPFGLQVWVRDYDDGEWYEGKFLGYDISKVYNKPYKSFPYMVFVEVGKSINWSQCKLPRGFDLDLYIENNIDIR